MMASSIARITDRLTRTTLSNDLEQQIEILSSTVNGAIQTLATITNEHIELALGFPWSVYYKFYHPAGCSGNAETMADARKPADVPDVFKRMFSNGKLPDEPRAE